MCTKSDNTPDLFSVIEEALFQKYLEPRLRQSLQKFSEEIIQQEEVLKTAVSNSDSEAITRAVEQLEDIHANEKAELERIAFWSGVACAREVAELIMSI